MAKHTRGQWLHLGNETKISISALIPIESSNLCETQELVLNPQLKITARLLSLLLNQKAETRVNEYNEPIPL